MKTESIDIGDFRYTVTQIMADDGVPLFCTFVNLCMGSSFNTFQDLIFGALRSKDLGPAVKEFYTAFAPTTQVTSLKGGGAAVQLDTIFRTHFAGNYGDLVKWLNFCFKLNLGERFLADVKSAVLKNPEEPDSPSPKSPEGTG